MQGKPGKPKSRWLQFSITTILVITTFAAGVVGWWRDRTQLLQQLEAERKQVERARLETEQAKVDAQVAKQQAIVAKISADKRRDEMQARLDQLMEEFRETVRRQASQQNP